METVRPGPSPSIKPKSYTYHAHVAWAGARGGTLSAAGKPSLRVASPPEFKGEAGVWSPEDLFVASVNVCTMTTFLAFAERKGLGLAAYESAAEGLLELGDDGFRFARITVRPRIRIHSADGRPLAESLIREAHAKCLISNSMRCEVRVEADVTVA